jgi:uncharacterized protein (TIGR00725 family)
MIKTTKKIKKVAFFGDATIKFRDEAYILAFNTAKLLAENGYIIINGGGPGIMEASTLGAKKGGGQVELVVLDPKKEPENYEGINKKNVKLANKITYTSNYPSRLNKLIEIADAFVIFKGGTGTLSEAGLVWELAKFDHGHHEPIIFFGKEWQHIIPELTKEMNYDKLEKEVATIATTPQEVLDILIKL